MLQTRALSIRVANRTLVAGLDWSMAAGQCWALLGRNGSGKTLLLQTLAGLRPAAAGNVLLTGRPIQHWPAIERARALALLTQVEPVDYWGSVADHVALGCLPQAEAGGLGATPGARGTPGSSGASDVGLLTRPEVVARALRCMHLGALAGRPWHGLSGGERQRTRIAQCLAQQALVQLWDEPLNHLDPAYQQLALDLARRMAAAGRTVVLSVHDPAAARRYCTHALLLYDSKHFTLGPVAEVLDETSLRNLYPLDPPEFPDPPPATPNPAL